MSPTLSTVTVPPPQSTEVTVIVPTRGADPLMLTLALSVICCMKFTASNGLIIEITLPLIALI